MEYEPIRRVLWALEYVNGRCFIGRFNEHWTRGGLQSAALFPSPDEADQARQALLTEANDRIGQQPHADQFWWDISGGLVLTREVEIVTRVVDRYVDSKP